MPTYEIDAFNPDPYVRKTYTVEADTPKEAKRQIPKIMAILSVKEIAKETDKGTEKEKDKKPNE